MKQKLIKYITIISLIIYISTSIFVQEVISLDEIWNFSNARNIANGLLPYKDFNLVVTPLYCMINSLSLKIFGTNLYIYRINYIVLTILLTFSISKLLSKFNINDYKKRIFIVIIIYFLIMFLYSDYNFFNMILLIIALYLETKDDLKTNPYNNLLIGIICGLMILTKQTTGIIISIVTLIIPFLLNYIYKEKNLKNIIIRIIGITLPLLLFIMFLHQNKLFYVFFDCTILGLKTFKSKINLEPIQIIIIIIIILTIIYLLKNLYKIYKTKDKNKKINLILIIYSLFSLSLNYPIIDPTHFTISILPTSIFFIKNHNFKIKANPLAILITILIIINIESYNNIKTYIQNYKPNNFKTYQFLIITPEHQNNLTKITDYIQSNNKTVILDHSASTYMLALNKYNHYFDVPLAGNIGSNGEKEMIKQLQKDNISILINKDPKTLKEELPKLYDYIMNNYQKIETIENFQVLKKLT